MSEPAIPIDHTAAIISGVFGLLTLVVNGIVAVFVARIAKGTTETARNMELVEKNTNSMKDALVQKTDEAAHARGMADEKVRKLGKDEVIAAAMQAGRNAAVAEAAGKAQSFAAGAAEKRGIQTDEP